MESEEVWWRVEEEEDGALSACVRARLGGSHFFGRDCLARGACGR